MEWVRFDLWNVVGRIFSNQRNQQACPKCYGGPLVVPGNDPNGLICSMCMYRYRSCALREIYDLTVFIDSKAGAPERILLTYLLQPMGDSFACRVGAHSMGMMNLFWDRETATEAKKVADAINRSKIKGVSAGFRMRWGWSYHGPFVTPASDSGSSKWGKWTTAGVDWALRLSGLYGLFEAMSNCVFWRGKTRSATRATLR